MKKVSIITPTYNHEEYIGQCIESVLAQTYQNWEQIIIDDGSSDGTKNIVRRYKDPRIRYYYQPHQGIFNLGKTYNRAFALAGGELIAILEGDDFWPPNKLETLVPVLNNPEIILAYGLTQLVTAKGKEEQLTIPTSHFLKRFPSSALFNDPMGTVARTMSRADVKTYTFPCSVIIKAETLKKIGGFLTVPGLPFVDYPTFITLSLEGKFFFAPKIMGYWRQHTQSNTQTRDEEKVNRQLRVFALKFLYHHQALLRLSASERKSIEETWKFIDVETRFKEGRKLLLTKEWEMARSKFKKVLLKEKRIRRWAAALFGYCASFFHCDIEPIFILVGRPSIKRFGFLPPKNQGNNKT